MLDIILFIIGLVIVVPLILYLLEALVIVWMTLSAIIFPFIIFLLPIWLIWRLIT